MDDLRSILLDMQEELQRVAKNSGYIRPDQKVVLTLEIYNVEDENEIETKIGALDPKIGRMNLYEFFSEERVAEAGFKINPNRVLLSRLWNNEIAGQRGKKLQTVGDLLQLGKKGVKKNIRNIDNGILSMATVILEKNGIRFE